MIGEIVILAIIVGSFSQPIARLWFPAQMLVYLVAGVIWIAPLRPLMIWMETGRWCAPKR